MAGSSILVINAAGAETRVALVESGTIHEFYLERKREKGIVGNIYKGRVVRVLPGMQAAFVDIGLEKAAFLYVGDVYGDPDFSEEFELTEGEHAHVLHEVPTEQEAEEQEARARADAVESEGRQPRSAEPAEEGEGPGEAGPSSAGIALEPEEERPGARPGRPARPDLPPAPPGTPQRAARRPRRGRGSPAAPPPPRSGPRSGPPRAPPR